MLFIVRYATNPAATGSVRDVYPRHRAYLDAFAPGGQLVSIGPLLPAPGSGAMAIFRSRAAAEAFPQQDPFVLEGLAVPQPIEEWDALELG